MPTHRSAMGKSVDMAALMAKNEKTRAVGNMNVNARGDTIDSHGRVIKPVTEKVTNNYSKTVGNRSAQATKQTKQVPQSAPVQKFEELNTLEKELEENINDDLEIEKIKAQEQKSNGT